MRITWCLMVMVLGPLFMPLSTRAQDSWTPEQLQVIAAIERLSAATAPDGGGAQAYGAVLAEEFSRWTIGSEIINNKEDWIVGIGEWFDDGWRVSHRKARILEVSINGDYAFTRRVIEETYLGPTGDKSESSAALAEVWVQGDGGWLLLQVNVHPLKDD